MDSARNDQNSVKENIPNKEWSSRAGVVLGYNPNSSFMSLQQRMAQTVPLAEQNHGDRNFDPLQVQRFNGRPLFQSGDDIEKERLLSSDPKGQGDFKGVSPFNPFLQTRYMNNSAEFSGSGSEYVPQTIADPMMQSQMINVHHLRSGSGQELASGFENPRFGTGPGQPFGNGSGSGPVYHMDPFLQTQLMQSQLMNGGLLQSKSGSISGPVTGLSPGLASGSPSHNMTGSGDVLSPGTTLNPMLNLDLPVSNFMKAVNFNALSKGVDEMEEGKENFNHSQVSDLYEQQQAMEQAQLLQRFKQLRQMQLQQQDILMQQQQQQLENLKQEQGRIQCMIARQREQQWGGTAGSPKRLRPTSSTPFSTPPRSGKRTQNSTVPQALASGIMAVSRSPQYQGHSQMKTLPDQELHSDTESNADTIGTEGVFPLPDTASEISESPQELSPPTQTLAVVEEHHSIDDTDVKLDGRPLSGMEVHKSPVQKSLSKKNDLTNSEQKKSVEKDGNLKTADEDEDNRPIKPGLSNKTKTFEELLEQQLQQEQEKEREEAEQKQFNKSTKNVVRSFLKRGQGLARFGLGSKNTPKTAPRKLNSPKNESYNQNLLDKGQEKLVTPPRKIASKALSSPHHPIPSLQLKPSPHKTQSSSVTQSLHTGKPFSVEQTGGTSTGKTSSVDASFLSAVKKIAKNEEMENEELEEFELLEQYADDNVSFSSNSSLVVKLIDRDKARKGQVHHQMSPLSKHIKAAKMKHQLHHSPLENRLEKTVEESEDNESSLGSSSDEDTDLEDELENNKTLVDQGESNLDEEYGTNVVKVVHRKIATRHSYEDASGVDKKQLNGVKNNSNGENQEGDEGFEEKDEVLFNSTEKGADSQLELTESEEDDKDEEEEEKEEIPEEYVEESDDNSEIVNKQKDYHAGRHITQSEKSVTSSPSPLIQQVLPASSQHVEFDDNESWGTSPSRENEDLRRSSNDGAGQMIGAATPPTSKLVSKLFPQLKPLKKDLGPEMNQMQQKQQQMVHLRQAEIGSGVQSKVLRDKLMELETEIERFRQENAALAKLRKEREEGLDKLKKEMAEFEKQKAEELERLQEFKKQEMKKLKHEKKVFEQYQKAARALPDKKERDEIEMLKNQLSELQEELKRKESRWTASTTRLRDRIQAVETENFELKEEVKLMERRRLDNWHKEQGNKKEASFSQPSKKPAIAQQKQEEEPKRNVDVRENNIPPPAKVVQKKVTSGPTGQHSSPLNMPEDTPRRQPTAIQQSDDLHSDTSSEVDAQEATTVLPRKRVLLNTNQIDKGSEHYEEIQHSDGKLERIYNNGAREILFANGTRKEISADGQYIIVSFFNGDVKQILPDQRVVYYYADAQTTHTTYTDGLEILQFPNNQMEKHYPDGTREITFPDQTIKYLFLNGSEESIFPDGTVIRVDKKGDKTMEFPNGQREIHTQQYKKREYPDGTAKLVYPDGRQETRYANGRVRIKDKDGNIVMDKR